MNMNCANVFFNFSIGFKENQERMTFGGFVAELEYETFCIVQLQLISHSTNQKWIAIMMRIYSGVFWPNNNNKLGIIMYRNVHVSETVDRYYDIIHMHIC